MTQPDLHRSVGALTRGQRGLKLAVAVLVVGLLGLAVVTLATANQAQEQTVEARAARADLLRRAQILETQVRRLGGKPAVSVPEAAPPQQPLPDVLEIQQPEHQERERQQPERQQDERQNPERQSAERQQGEAQEAETQQDEVQDPEEQEPEIQDPEVDDPEQQDPEVQDPEIDDPDPNSALTFNVEDNCNPADGEFVTDVSAAFRRDPGTLTLVLTCTTAVPPAPPAQPQ